MRRLLLSILVTFVVSFTHSHAQSCKVDVITLKARVEANPGSVLYAFGDSIALYPHCIAEFIEAAITAAKPDDATLTQIIELAVSEYPAEVTTIAEAAVLAAPDSVDVIRKAFIPKPKQIVASPVETDGSPENRSPIENFLTNYRPAPRTLQASPPVEAPAPPAPPEVKSIEFTTSKLSDPNDIATKALKAIDDLLADLEAAPRGPTIQPGVEKFRLAIPNQAIAISTLDDARHRDVTDELLDEPSTQPLIFKDSVSEVEVAKNIKVETKKVQFTAAVQQIPSSLDILNQIRPPMPSSSVSVSPTSPRAR